MRLKALQMLVVASAFWGLSFPTTKALAVSQQELLPASRWFVASLCVVYRFAIAASLVFTGQILWLERPQYAGINVRHFSLVMFVVMAAVALPVALVTTRQWGDWFQAQLPSSASRQNAANIGMPTTDQGNGQILGQLDDTSSR